jgi:hypothetical protein
VLWLTGWAAVLWSVHRPWLALGGLVGERLRWLERFVLASGLVVGSTAGGLVRDAAATKGRRAAGLRWLLYPPAVTSAAAMAALDLAGRDDPIGVLLVGWLSYTAGASSAHFGIASWCRGERAPDGGTDGPGPGAAV